MHSIQLSNWTKIHQAYICKKESIIFTKNKENKNKKKQTYTENASDCQSEREKAHSSLPNEKQRLATCLVDDSHTADSHNDLNSSK